MTKVSCSLEGLEEVKGERFGKDRDRVQVPICHGDKHSGSNWDVGNQRFAY